MATTTAEELAKALEGLISDNDISGVEALLNPVVDGATIQDIANKFSLRDPVIEAIDQQHEEIAVHLLEKTFPYTRTYTWPDSQCDAWCQSSHQEHGGRCPGSYTAVDVAKRRDLGKVVKMLDDLSRGVRAPGDGLPPHSVVTGSSGGGKIQTKTQTKIKIDDSSLPKTQAMEARELIEKLGENYMGKNGNLLIHQAASTSPAMVHVCANCGHNINAQNFSGDTGLHLAVKHGEPEIVRAMLMNGADLSIRNKLGQTAHDLSSGYCTQLLDLYKPGLPIAVCKGDAAAIQRLIRLWCNPNAQIKDGQTAFQIAESRSGEDVIAEKCYRILQIHKSTLSVVHAVLSENKEQLQKILSEHKGWNVNIRYQDLKGPTPISCALKQHNLSIVMILVEQGKCALNIRVKDTFASTDTVPLLFMSLDPDCPTDVWQFLHQHVDHDQSMEKDKDGNTALLRAICDEHTPTFIKCLIDDRRGLSLVERNSQGLNARELAVSLNRLDIVKVLDQAVMERVGDYFLLNLPVNFYGLENLDIQNENGEKLCDVVKQEEDVMAINIYQSVEDRAVELFEAAAKGNVEVVKKLNTVAFRDKNGFTALTRAIVFKQPKVVEALITSQPALKTTPDNNNCYPLHYAYAMKDGDEMITLLTAKNPHHIEHKVDKNGMEAAEYKELRDTSAIRQMLIGAITVDAYGQKAHTEE